MADTERRNPWKEPKWVLTTIGICTLSFGFTLGTLAAFIGRMHGERLGPEQIIALSGLAALIAALVRHILSHNGNGKNGKP